MDGIAAGAISAIATDHAPHPGSEKMQEFERCPFGIIGFETAVALAIEELVRRGRITLNRMVELFTTGPERSLRLGRGTLAPGAPGDVTVFSTEFEWTLRREPVAVAQPQLAVRRPDVPRRPGGHGGERRSGLETRRITGSCGQVPAAGRRVGRLEDGTGSRFGPRPRAISERELILPLASMFCSA